MLLREKPTITVTDGLFSTMNLQLRLEMGRQSDSKIFFQSKPSRWLRYRTWRIQTAAELEHTYGKQWRCKTGGGF